MTNASPFERMSAVSAVDRMPSVGPSDITFLNIVPVFGKFSYTFVRGVFCPPFLPRALPASPPPINLKGGMTW